MSENNLMNPQQKPDSSFIYEGADIEDLLGNRALLHHAHGVCVQIGQSLVLGAGQVEDAANLQHGAPPPVGAVGPGLGLVVLGTIMILVFHRMREGQR